MKTLTKQFAKKVLKELVDYEEYFKESTEDIGPDELPLYRVISNEISGSSRWSIYYDMIFEEVATNTFYSTTYSVGATESQDERPYEYAGDLIEVNVVVPYEKTIIAYKCVPDPKS